MSEQKSSVDWEVVFERSPIPTAVIDRDRKIVSINRAFIELAGKLEIDLSQRDRIGRDILEFIDPTIDSIGVEGWRKIYSDLLERGTTYRNPEYVCGKRVYDVQANPLRDSGGEIVGAVITREEVTERVRRNRALSALRSMNDAVLAMRRSEDIGKVLMTLHEALKTTGIEFDHCSIQVVDEEGLFFRGHYLAPDLSARQAGGIRRTVEVPLAGTSIEEAWKKQQVVYRPDLNREDPFNERTFLRQDIFAEPTRSVLDVPFSRGTIGINSVHPEAFSDEDIDIVQGFATALSEGYVRYEDLRRLEDQKEKAEHALSIASGFYSISSSLTTASDLHATLEVVVENALRIAEAEYGVVILVDEERREVRRIAGKAYVEGREVPYRPEPPRSEGLTWNVVNGRKPVVVSAGENGSVAMRREDLERGMRWIAGIPVTSREKMLGVLVVGSVRTSGIREEALRTLTAFADEAAVAIERNQMVEELKWMQAQLVQSERLAAVGQLAAGVAHEINNPLTGVMGYAELLLMGDLDPKIRRDIEKIQHGADRVRSIVRDLQLFATRGQREKAEYFDLNEAIEGTVTLVRKAFSLDGVEVIEEFGEMVPVWGNIGRMQQVFMNLLTNARDAITSSKKGSYIRIRTWMEGKDRVGISVEDNGPGISPNVRERVFEPFFTTKKVGKGTGLGLSISYGIVRDLEGDIRVESEEGKGTRFVIELPVRERKKAEEPAGERREESIPGARILVVDDEEDIVELVCEVLRGEGHSVEAAGEGETALRRIARKGYDLVLLDLKLPEMSGQRVYEEIKSRWPPLAENVVFITGDVGSKETAAFLESTGNLYVSKPFRVATLRDVVKKILAGSLCAGRIGSER